MIKFTGETKPGGDPILGLGLEQGNWDRLLAGKPIVIKPSELGLPWKGEIFIMAGSTQQDMLNELARAGALHETLVHPFDETKDQKH